MGVTSADSVCATIVTIFITNWLIHFFFAITCNNNEKHYKYYVKDIANNIQIMHKCPDNCITYKNKLIIISSQAIK